MQSMVGNMIPTHETNSITNRMVTMQANQHLNKVSFWLSLGQSAWFPKLY